MARSNRPSTTTDRPSGSSRAVRITLHQQSVPEVATWRTRLLRRDCDPGAGQGVDQRPVNGLLPLAPPAAVGKPPRASGMAAVLGETPRTDETGFVVRLTDFDHAPQSCQVPVLQAAASLHRLAPEAGPQSRSKAADDHESLDANSEVDARDGSARGRAIPWISLQIHGSPAR